jgi:hypothetical protein
VRSRSLVGVYAGARYAPNNHSAEAFYDGLVPLIRTLPAHGQGSLVENHGSERALVFGDTRFLAICIRYG